jgi:SPP1 family phage portal protein
MRTKNDIYPDYTAEIEEIEKNGITEELLQRIIHKHKFNSLYNHKLFDRYQVLKEGVPIFQRESRYDEDDPINNKVNNDFFGEAVDFMTGYFAGLPFSYNYSDTEESKEMTGGEKAVEEASKALSDFVTRNNMYDKDMEMTKQGAICGYCGRLFYIDEEGHERVMILPGYEVIILSKTDMCEPQYAVWYRLTKDINDNKVWKVEFYDAEKIWYYEGNLSNLKFIKTHDNMYDYCPLQGIPHNSELMGTAERALAAMDDYDRTISDNSNDIESFSTAYMVFENIMADDKEIEKAQKSGAIKFKTGPAGGKVYFLTKDANDTLTENHLNRLKDEIYKFTKTPNLDDDSFGTASGISLKFKLLGLETKCGMYQAKVDAAALYMFKLLASCWRKKRINVDPLQCFIEYKRNFPVDVLGDANAAQTLINLGIPLDIACDKTLSFMGKDDIDYMMDRIEEEKNSIPDLFGDDKGDDPDAQNEPPSNKNKKDDEE